MGISFRSETLSGIARLRSIILMPGSMSSSCNPLKAGWSVIANAGWAARSKTTIHFLFEVLMKLKGLREAIYTALSRLRV